MGRDFLGTSSQYCKASPPPVTGIPLTMSCWAYKPSLTTDTCIMYLGRGGSGVEQYDYHAMFLRSTASNSNKLQIISNDQSSSTAVVNCSTYKAGEWLHCCAVFAATNSRTGYLNGVGTSNTTSVSVSASGLDKLCLAIWDHQIPGLYFTGTLAEPAIWSAALTSAEVNALASGTISPCLIRPSALVGYWHPRSVVRTSADRDFSGGGFDMVPFNAPTWGSDPPQTVQRRKRRVGVVATGNRRRRVIIGAAY